MDLSGIFLFFITITTQVFEYGYNIYIKQTIFFILYDKQTYKRTSYP